MFGTAELVLILVSGLVLLGLLAGLAWGLWAIVKGTKQKSGMGINLSPPTACPQCRTRLPQVRIPKNMRQLMWGGWTCESCGVQLDKWGRQSSDG